MINTNERKKMDTEKEIKDWNRQIKILVLSTKITTLWEIKNKVQEEITKLEEERTNVEIPF
tara:strand:+ start:301 stop:483 length:183 start_codon:yes stop_codon:yes gene_type:complete